MKEKVPFSLVSEFTKAYKGTISRPFGHNCKAIRYFSLFWLFRTEGAARAEPSLFELCRVVSEEDALGDDRRPLRSNAEQEVNGSIFDEPIVVKSKYNVLFYLYHIIH